MKNIGLVFAVVFLLLLVLLLPMFFWGASAKPMAPVVLPNPNGWDSFNRIGRQINMVQPTGDEGFTADEAAAVMSTNQRFLEELELARDEIFIVPTRTSTDRSDDGYTETLSAIRSCFRLWMAEAGLAEAEERWNEAAEIHLKIVGESRKLHENGTFLTCAIGAAYEKFGSEGLVRVALKLTPSEAQEQLTAWKRRGPTSLPGAVVDREKAMSGRNRIIAKLLGARADELMQQMARVNAEYVEGYRMAELALEEAVNRTEVDVSAPRPEIVPGGPVSDEPQPAPNDLTAPVVENDEN